jgi:hypothetical protein
MFKEHHSYCKEAETSQQNARVIRRSYQSLYDTGAAYVFVIGFRIRNAELWRKSLSRSLQHEAFHAWSTCRPYYDKIRE